MRIRLILATLLLALLSTAAAAQDGLAPELQASIDKATLELLAKTGAPSASIAIVKDGKLAYAKAYGLAQIDPKRPATADMRYSIGSISKQFTAAAILLLAEEGKLSLDDRVIRWFPELTRAGDITIRQLLSMTSGYQDFWPQDYVMPMMLESIPPQQILERWAKIPLDFEPGTKWQYSNTNYVIAGLIVEKVSGEPLMQFMQKRIFGPLKMTSVADSDRAALPAADASRYRRSALAAVRPAPKEGSGWMFGAGHLAMTASDLARWNIAMIEQSAMTPKSYRQLEREVQLANGVGTRYGLGVSVAVADSRRSVSHGGEVSGFTANNVVWPEEKAAVTVLTNLDATNASDQIGSKIASLLFATSDPATAPTLTTMRSVFEGLQKGKIDRTLFTSNANAYFDELALKDFASSLGPLGKPQEFTQIAQSLRGGMTLRRYRIKFADRTLRLTTFIMPDGKIEQYLVAAAE